MRNIKRLPSSDEVLFNKVIFYDIIDSEYLLTVEEYGDYMETCDKYYFGACNFYKTHIGNIPIRINGYSNLNDAIIEFNRRKLINPESL